MKLVALALSFAALVLFSLWQVGVMLIGWLFK